MLLPKNNLIVILSCFYTVRRLAILRLVQLELPFLCCCSSKRKYTLYERSIKDFCQLDFEIMLFLDDYFADNFSFKILIPSEAVSGIISNGFFKFEILAGFKSI
ncbi:hypothetical protein D3C80_1350900 [compost metagenome]